MSTVFNLKYAYQQQRNNKLYTYMHLWSNLFAEGGILLEKEGLYYQRMGGFEKKKPSNLWNSHLWTSNSIISGKGPPPWGPFFHN